MGEPHQRENQKKNKNLNVKFTESDYKALQEVANLLGTTLSSLIRLLIYERLNKYRETNNPRDFLD